MSDRRFDFFLLIIPFILWIYCFRFFFTGHLWLYEDAISYAQHIGLYTDYLSRGIYPLWDPTWFYGAPNDFFLRRIGDLNPLLFLIVFLKWLGVSSSVSYLVFLGVYYFLAGWAFYLIALLLFNERFLAFNAYILFLFSSWGSEIFYNYIIIIFVPMVWFFVFLLYFRRESKPGFALGMCFCMGLCLTTYIPFLFFIILFLFTLFYALFYGRDLMVFLKQACLFLDQRKFFAAFCAFFILVSCIPALMFYKQSKNSEFALPGRHAGAGAASAVAVSLDSVESGDIISHGYFDRLFDDHADIDLGDVYIPYVFFVFLLTGVCGRVNKLIFFLLFNILAFSLITMTSVSWGSRFLYEHLPLFKFIRQIYYFFWLAMLPMAILLGVAGFKSLLATIDASPQKKVWALYILACHGALILFLCTRQGVLAGAWAAVLISLVYFVLYFSSPKKIAYAAGAAVLLLAVFIQSAQVYKCLDIKLFKVQAQALKPVPAESRPEKLDLYYASQWFTVLVNYIDPQALNHYCSHLFVLYNNVWPYVDSPDFFKAFQTTIAAKADLAYIPKSESDPEDWKGGPQNAGQADMDPVLSGKLSVVHSDANGWVLKAHLPQGQFLVVNDNYNSAWHALINGQAAHLFRANVAFKGLWLPAGESTVVLRFSSGRHYAFRWALIALFAGTFLYLLALLRKKEIYA